MGKTALSCLAPFWVPATAPTDAACPAWQGPSLSTAPKRLLLLELPCIPAPPSPGLPPEQPSSAHQRNPSVSRQEGLGAGRGPGGSWQCLGNSGPGPQCRGQPSRPRVGARPDRELVRHAADKLPSSPICQNRFFPCFYLSIQSEDYLSCSEGLLTPLLTARPCKLGFCLLPSS